MKFAILFAIVAAATALPPGCEEGDTFSSVDGARCDTAPAKRNGPTLSTEAGNVIVETGSSNGDSGAFVVIDRTNDRTLTLPGDFDTFVSDAETRQEESQATLQTGIDTVSAKLTEEVEASEKKRREEESAIATSITDSFEAQDSIMKDILAEIKKSNVLAETTNKGIAKLAEGAGSKWLAAGSGAKVAPGSTQEVYGRNFLPGATSIYKVTAQDVDGDGNVVGGSKPINQPVLEVGQSVIKFTAVHGAPDDKDATYKTNVKVVELGETLEGPDAVLTWIAAGPLMTFNNYVHSNPPADGIVYDKLVATKLTIPFTLTDGDDKISDVTTTAVSGNEKAILTKTLKIVGEGVQRQLVVTAMVAKGTSIIKVTAKDPLGATAVLSIKVKVVEKDEVRMDGWALVMKIRGSDGSDDTKNECTKYTYDNPVWTNTKTDGDEKDFSLKAANRKLPDYMKVKFQTIRVCSGDAHAKKGGAECFAYTFEGKWDSAQQLFSECDKGANHNFGSNPRIYCRDQKNGALKNGMLRVFSISGQRDCDLQRPGFSQIGNDNARTRWGWLSNLASQGCQPADGEDSDAAVGLGLHQQDGGCACGAGNTPWFNDSQGYKGCKHCKNAWVWVKIA